MKAASFWTRVRLGYRGVALFWLNVCLFLLFLNGLAALAVALRSPGFVVDEASEEHVDRALAQIYSNWTPEARALLREEAGHDFVPEALVQLREDAFEGRYFNIDPNGFRVGREQGVWPPDPAYYNIYFFGGSTGMGYGVEDRETVASHLQQMLAQGGTPRPPRLYNFSRGAYYSVQERLTFDRLAMLGPRPDAAIFLDGLNDFAFPMDPPVSTAFATKRGDEDLRHPWRRLWRSLPILQWVASFGERTAFEYYEGQRAALEAKKRSMGEDEKIEEVIRRYLANMQVIESIASMQGIRAVFVWQPVPTYGYDLRHHVFDGHFGRHELARRGYPRMREVVEAKPPGDDFIWCAEIQRGARELLYVDKVHYSPDMSRQVAQCIAQGIRERGLAR